MAASQQRQPAWRLYVDTMSQPSRACIIFSRANALPVQEQLVLIHKQEQRKPEFMATVNALGKLPVLEQLSVGPGQHHPPAGAQPWLLPESAAILSLLADTHQVPEHWLPRSDRLQRARVEAALHWYHATIRLGCARLLFNRVLAPKMGGVGNEAVAADALTILKRSLKELEGVWLGGGARAFVAGGPAPSLADLLMACEVEQLTMLNKERHGVDMAELLSGHPHVRAWMAAVARATAPHYEQVHAMLRRAAAAGHGTQSPSQPTAELALAGGAGHSAPRAKL